MAQELYKNATVVDVTSADQIVRGTAIYVGTAGNISLITTQGQGITFENVPAGIFPVAHNQINTDGTVPTDLVSLI
tara:strand:- start:416 stop:643 length:228 start_codon:yes stop_codon:yes gene_type:complete